MEETSKHAEKLNPEYWYDQTGLPAVKKLLGTDMQCPACGKVHQINTRLLEEKADMAGRIGEYLPKLGLTGRCLIVMDKRTQKAAGDRLVEGLSAYNPRTLVFEEEELHADEKAIGSLLIAMSDKPDFLVSCGSGTITDITRYNSCMTGVPFIAYATAPSVDGFASSSTPVLVNGFKTTYPGVAPIGIFYDKKVLAKAPDQLIAAGFGDALAKVTALLDWRLAHAAEGEEYCPLVAAIVDKAVKACLDLADDLAVEDKNRVYGDGGVDVTEAKENACADLMETLLLTGIAMQMMGFSRPASGAEHHISHLLEMRDVQRHKKGSLHGDKVGIGTLISMSIYLRLFKNKTMPEQRARLGADIWDKEVRRVFGPLADQAIAINTPYPPSGREWEEQKQRLEQAMEDFGYSYIERFKTLLPFARDRIIAMNGPVRPQDLGYGRRDTYDAIAFGKEVRPKFTALRIAERYGWLYDLAEEIANGLPEGKIY